jgi:diguanylate cyclase (GGDEF)-like protein/PAS domain S-box-containing protein
LDWIAASEVRVSFADRNVEGALSSVAVKVGDPVGHEDNQQAMMQALMEATLDAMNDALVVTDQSGRVVMWNHAAEDLTGYRRADRLGKPLPAAWVQSAHRPGEAAVDAAASDGHGHFYTGVVSLTARPEDGMEIEPGVPGHAVRAELHHALGHSVSVMIRQFVLRDELGGRIGACANFYPAEDFDRLPHGESSDGKRLSRVQGEMQEWLEESFRAAQTTEIPFGLLWIMVDQGQGLRKTHGRDACEEMMQAVERTLSHGLRPSEMLGRWGESEFLVVSHERNTDLLMEHGHRLAGEARTTEFRWWGDRIGLTLSVGAAQWHPGCTLTELLGQAQNAMQASVFAGGNQVRRGYADQKATSQN